MREQRLEIEGIPTKLYEPDGAAGLLLLGHGGGHSKDEPSVVQHARDLAASTGLAVACIDAVDHGERCHRVATSPGIPARWHSSAAPRMTSDWVTVAEGLAHVGPPVAYVGFSMGAIFGVFTAAAMPQLQSVVLVVGGIPVGWVDDPPIRELLLDAARSVVHPSVLMVNMTDDALFPVSAVHPLFDAIACPDRQLTFWPGSHDAWPPEAMRLSTEFVLRHRSTAG